MMEGWKSSCCKFSIVLWALDFVRYFEGFGGSGLKSVDILIWAIDLSSN